MWGITMTGSGGVSGAVHQMPQTKNSKHVRSEMHAGKDSIPAPFLLFRNHPTYVTLFCGSWIGGKFVIFVLMLIVQ